MENEELWLSKNCLKGQFAQTAKKNCLSFLQRYPALQMVLDLFAQVLRYQSLKFLRPPQYNGRYNAVSKIPCVKIASQCIGF